LFVQKFLLTSVLNKKQKVKEIWTNKDNFDKLTKSAILNKAD